MDDEDPNIAYDIDMWHRILRDQVGRDRIEAWRENVVVGTWEMGYCSCVSSVGLEAADQLLYCYVLSCCVQDKLVNEQAERRPAARSARSDWLKQGCQLARLDGLSPD